MVSQQVTERQNILMGARSAIAGASGPEQHRVILSDTLNKLGMASREQGASKLSTGHKVGDSVTLRNGKTVTIKKVNPDNTFDY